MFSIKNLIEEMKTLVTDKSEFEHRDEPNVMAPFGQFGVPCFCLKYQKKTLQTNLPL